MRSLLLCLSLSCTAIWGQGLTFKGKFARIGGSAHPACTAVFSETHYGARFFYLEPRRTAIVHFEHTNSDAFFEGMSLYGLLGYGNDIRVDRSFKINQVEYDVIADGLVNRDLLLMDLKVSARDEAGNGLCEVTAEYSGFPE